MSWIKLSAIVISLLAAFVLGQLSVEPEIKVIEKEVKVDYWDVTKLTEEKIEVAASIFGKTLQDAKEISELHNKNKVEINKREDEINKIYDNRRDEAEKIRHYAYQEGYIKGFQNGKSRQ